MIKYRDVSLIMNIDSGKLGKNRALGHLTSFLIANMGALPLCYGTVFDSTALLLGVPLRRRVIRKRVDSLSEFVRIVIDW